MIKLKLKLSPLELSVERIPDSCSLKSARGQAFPFAPARAFIEQLDKLKGKTLRTTLQEKYTEIFGVAPSLVLTHEAIRARCIYRLQIEGHRIAGLVPPSKLQSNYNAMMRASDIDPFNGLDADTMSIANMTALLEGDAQMAKLKAKPKAAAVKPKRESTSTRPKIYDTYSMCFVIKFLAAKKFTTGQIEAVLTLLGIKVNPSTHSTVVTTVSDIRRGRYKAGKLAPEHESKLLKLVPPEPETKTVALKKIDIKVPVPIKKPVVVVKKTPAAKLKKKVVS